MELNISRIFSLIITRLKYIIIVALIFAALFFGFTKLFIDEKYESSAKILVVMNTTTSKSTEAAFVKEAVHSYLEIFNTTKFLTEVTELYNANNPENELKPSKLKEMTRIEASSNTDAPSFSVKVTSGSSKLSYNLATLISSHMITRSAEYEALNPIKIIDNAIEPKFPSSPNIILNSILGFVLGAAIVIGYLVVREMFDNKIKNLEDITSSCEIPILGVVPDASNNDSVTSFEQVLLD